MKENLGSFLAVTGVAIFSALLVSSPLMAASPALPNIEAKSFLLMDYETGQVLVQNNADEPLPPASLTKIMTSYIISDELEKGAIKSDDKVLISENAWAQNPKLKGSSLMFVEVNKYVLVDDLLKGIVIQSGNDASIAMAEHIAGTEDAFAELMNVHAKRLGMKSTHYENSTGLPDEGHLTTAKDLAVLSRALIEDFPADYALYSEREYRYNGITQQNRNDLLKDQGLQVDGLKTGHTEEAGYCLVSSAVNDETRLIAVVMGTDSNAKRTSESRKLLNYGFRFYTNVTPFEGGKTLKKVRVWKGEENEFAAGLAEDATISLLKSDKANLKANYVLTPELIAPIAKGQKVGEVTFKVNGKVVKKMPMVALEAVQEAGFFGRMWDSVKLWF
ncbi:D-alanyl-D-alanine carboxypeptidase family protein [Kangiella sp. TOML190]|uniref:D-alanyl-D-alanine carboxypeptidase family protein n=1 Tax=Kangiella sp. TOML190 TaxID=2931351 RepID=UPI0035D79197